MISFAGQRAPRSPISRHELRHSHTSHIITKRVNSPTLTVISSFSHSLPATYYPPPSSFSFESQCELYSRQSSHAINALLAAHLLANSNEIQILFNARYIPGTKFHRHHFLRVVVFAVA